MQPFNQVKQKTIDLEIEPFNRILNHIASTLCLGSVDLHQSSQSQ